ncbi:MAG: hypothetical protein RJA70_515 [Pseudomonadota bacterium]|jgi:hypothetical protein
MLSFKSTVSIPCAPDVVWAVMTDWRKSAYWIGVENLRLADPNKPEREGTRLLFTARGQQTTVIRAWEPGRKLTLESVQGGVTATYCYTLASGSGQTQVNLTAECSAIGFIWRALLPLIARVMAWTDKKQLAALKRLTQAMLLTAEREADRLEGAVSKPPQK